jgi:hypothetical protein
MIDGWTFQRAAPKMFIIMARVSKSREKKECQLEKKNNIFQNK